MTTIKLTPTQKRQMLATIVTYKVKQNEDITAYVGRNLGDFNYEELYNNMGISFGREINDVFMEAKYGKTETETKTTKSKSEGSKKYSKLTKMEGQVYDYLLASLEDWIGSECYTPENADDISKGTGIPDKSLKGVLSSLKKKDLLWSAEIDADNSFTNNSKMMLWYFPNQDETTVEELIAKVK